jgi:pantothenate kinase
MALPMTKRVLYASLYVLAFLITVQDIAAFTTSLRYARFSSSAYATKKTKKYTDGKKSVEMKQGDDIQSVPIKSKPIQQPDTTKKQLVSNIQETVQEVMPVNTTPAAKETPAPLQGLSSMQSSSFVARPMMSPFHEVIAPPNDKKSSSPESGGLAVANIGPAVLLEERTEAKATASLYMNPVTAKIASNVKITWEPQVAELLLAMEKVSNPNRPMMVGLVGIPGSGKSTSAEILATLLRVNGRGTLVMPHDGFHIPLAKLTELPDAERAIYTRGAPDTFDPAFLAETLTRISYGKEPTVSVPGFDHAVGDPVPNQHVFERSKHRIVLCEGLYLLHDDNGWERIKSFFDWTIYIEADVDACIERLKTRNKCIPVS